MFKYIFFLLFLSVHAQAEQIILCDEAPCVLIAKTVMLKNKSIENATLYGTRSDFYVEVPSNFALAKHWQSDILFEYSDKKWIGFSRIDWKSINLSETYDQIYKIDRQDMQIFFHQRVDNSKGSNVPSYTAFISHKDMSTDKFYTIESMGFTLKEFKQVLATIRRKEPKVSNLFGATP